MLHVTVEGPTHIFTQSADNAHVGANYQWIISNQVTGCDADARATWFAWFLLEALSQQREIQSPYQMVRQANTATFPPCCQFASAGVKRSPTFALLMKSLSRVQCDSKSKCYVGYLWNVPSSLFTHWMFWLSCVKNSDYVIAYRWSATRLGVGLATYVL
jgi:hypothetical protein